MRKRVIAGVFAGALLLSGCGTGSTAGSSVKLPTGPEEAEIFVEAVPEISDDFIRGMDASSVFAEEASGVTYYNFDGEAQDVFQTLAESGVNYIRLRVWNDPYDENGNGYGGGNNDSAKAIALGKRATDAGMKVCIDFHYSDFWADPKRQHTPKAWVGLTKEEKADALYDFTKESLTEYLDAGVDVGMVQIGNEINNGMMDESSSLIVADFLKAGSRAVREVASEKKQDIKVVVHYTNIDDPSGIDRIAGELQEREVDFDVFGLSYYPFWQGDLENMQSVVKTLREKYGKEVVLAETSYCYTAEDGDGYANSLSGTNDLVAGYPATVQGQATMVRDVCAAANEAGAEGVFYWEGTWVPVGPADQDNSALWEEFGSGWASSYAAEYDPDDAGLYYGGCSWDNQAFFDFTGHPLASLNVFKYLKYGATAPLAVDGVENVYVSQSVGSPVELPETVDVIYNDRTKNTAEAVTWDAEALSAVDTDSEGEYEIPGALSDGTEVVAYLMIKDVNLVANPSFEDADTSIWTVTYEGSANPTDFQVKEDDAHSGETAFHFWSGDSDMDFAIEQVVTGLADGTYRLKAYAQGGDVDETAEMELYAVTADGELTQAFMVTGWADWQEPAITDIPVTGGSVTVGVRIKTNKGSWGTIDDFTLNKIGE